MTAADDEAQGPAMGDSGADGITMPASRNQRLSEIHDHLEEGARG